MRSITFLVAAIIQYVNFSSFKTAWMTSSTVAALAGSFNLSTSILLTIVGLTGVVGGFYAVYALSAWIIVEINLLFRKLNEYSQYKKPFLMLFMMYMLAASAIIMANVSYIDDMGRKAWGYSGWDTFSRYMSNFFSQLIHTNSYLADISPLTQIIAVLLITAASLIVIITFSEADKISFWSLVAVMPLGISPYFLECISYKYDSPYMAISIFASVVPLLFYKYNSTIYVPIVLLGTLLACTTYQAALGIFPTAVLILAFCNGNNMFRKIRISN